MSYLMENMGDIFVGLIVVVCAFFVIKSQLPGKKKKSCAGGCSNCSGGDSSKSIHLKNVDSGDGVHCGTHCRTNCDAHSDVHCGIHPVGIIPHDTVGKNKD